MSWRTTAVLALVVAALGAFVFFYEIRGAEERSERAEAEKRLFQGVEADQISLVTLRTKDGNDARVERIDGAWKLLAPFAFPADDATMQSIASTLASLRSEAVIDEPGPPAEYGLAGEPRVRFRAGEREHVLRIGDRSPVGSNTYVATAADAPVYVVASFRATSLERSLDELRDKRPLRFEREAVVEVRVRWKDGGVRLRRDEQDPEVWRLVEPLAADGDARTVSRLLSDLEFLRATGFDDAPSAEVLRALDAPELAVELETRADGKKGRAELAIGAASQGTERPARGSASSAVYKLPGARYDDLPRSVDAYRDKTLARFAESEARRFEIAFHAEHEGQSHVVTGRREEDAWKTEPEAMKAESVETMLRELSGLEATRIAAESMGSAERAALGLEPPRVVVRVLGGPEAAQEATLAEVHLGVVDATRGIAARRPDRATVYWLPGAREREIPTSLEALRKEFVEPPAAEEAEPAAAPTGERGADPAAAKPAEPAGAKPAEPAPPEREPAG
jgi:hypothetical protein